MGRVIEGAGPLRSGNPQGFFFVWDMTGNRFGSETRLKSFPMRSQQVPSEVLGESLTQVESSSQMVFISPFWTQLKEHPLGFDQE